MAEVKQEDQASSIDLKKHTDSKLTLKEEFPLRWLNFRLFLCILSSVDIIEIVRAMAINNLGLDFSMTHDDITAFEFIAKDSLRNLKHACYTEKIRDFLHCVFVESGAANVLGRGDFRWKLFIYKMSPEEYHNYTQVTGKFIQATMVEKKEELDPGQLFGDLMIMGLVGETDKVMDCIPRKQRIEFLIGRLANKKRTDEMHKILMVHCMKYDCQYLWKKINDIFRGDTGNLNFTGKRVEDESFPDQKIFTAHITISVQVKKRVVSPKSDQEITLLIPITLHKAFQEDHRQSFWKELILAGDKIQVEPSFKKSLFQKPSDLTVCIDEDLFAESEPCKFLMVGRFSELRMMNNMIQEHFCGRSVVFPFGACNEWMAYIPSDKKIGPPKWKNSSSAAEKQVVGALRTAYTAKMFRTESRKLLGLEFQEVYSGSIIIRFTTEMGKSLQKLKEACALGKIRDFLPNIFKGTGVESKLGLGDFMWKFSVYKEPCRSSRLCLLEAGSAIEIQKEKLNPIKLHWNLFVEELDPRKLFADLETKGLFGDKDGIEMLKLVSRKDKMKFLLEQLLALREPDLSYEILLDHCREHDEYVLLKIKEKEHLQVSSKDQEQSTSTGSRSDRPSDQELIFTATIILSVRRKAYTHVMKENTSPVSDMEFEISCLDVQEPVCYFNDMGEDVEGDDDLQEEIFMKLEQVREPEEERISVKKKQPCLKRKRNMQIDVLWKRTWVISEEELLDLNKLEQLEQWTTLEMMGMKSKIPPDSA